MPETILVGLDGSERQDAVLQAALRSAQASGSKVHLCRAVTVPVSIPASAWTMQGDELVTHLVDHAEQTLREVAAQIPEEHRGSTFARLGQPAQILCDLASECSATTLVIGSHGYGAVERLLGTTAAKVVNYAPCNVLVVRPPKG